MTVYVDEARNAYRRMIVCHMIADSLEELHAMATKIGLQRRWAQLDASFPHYDLSISRRKAAIAAGAVVVTRQELARLMKALRADPKFIAAWKAELTT